MIERPANAKHAQHVHAVLDLFRGDAVAVVSCGRGLGAATCSNPLRRLSVRELLSHRDNAPTYKTVITGNVAPSDPRLGDFSNAKLA